MTAYSKHSALFFLLVFTAYLVAGNAVNGLKYYSPASDAWKTACEKSTLELEVHIHQGDPEFSTSEQTSDDETGAKLLNCNSSLQLFATANNFSFDPGQGNQSVHTKVNFFSSQVFVFQEPDPPRLI